MQINTQFLIYTLSIGFFTALHFSGFKMLKGDPSVSLFWMFVLVTIINFFIVFVHGDKFFSKGVEANIPWIFLSGTMAVIFPYLIVRWLQSGFSPVLFPLSNTIISTAFLLFISYFFFKSNLNMYNAGGLLLGVGALYLLSIK